jgi:photosystem II stability/assembly factor-like uncharacterized protein
VLYSIDGGKSWKQSSLETGVATEIVYAQDGTTYVSMLNGDLYRSNDGGENWSLVSQNITSGINKDLFDPDLFDPVLISLAVDSVDPSRLYAGFTQGGVLVSEDGGENWKPSLAGMVPETSILDLAVDQTHPGVIYAASGDSGVYRSLNHGETWMMINEGLSNRAGRSLSLSADGSYLYLATDGGGVYRLSPDGRAPESVDLSDLQEKESDRGQDQTEDRVDGEMPPSPDEDPSAGRQNPPNVMLVVIGLFLVVGGIVISVWRKRVNQ